MNDKHSCSVCKRGIGLLLVAAFAAGTAFAAGNIDPANSYAWSENSGWQNWNSPNGGGVTVNVATKCLSGYAWGENIGWVKLGADAGGPYLNTAANNYGVNMSSAGTLSGYAWSETCGWINFNSSPTNVIVNRATGSFDGYAWAENIGWVHFKSVVSPVYNVRTMAVFSHGTSVFFR